HNQFIAVAGALIAATFAFGSTKIDFSNTNFLNPNLLVLIGVVEAFIIAAWIAVSASWRHTRHLGEHVANLETQINRLVGGAPLLNLERSRLDRQISKRVTTNFLAPYRRGGLTKAVLKSWVCFCTSVTAPSRPEEVPGQATATI